MHSCILCKNTSMNTRAYRPAVLYHKFPKNEYYKKKWFEVLRIHRCHEWHRVCSDHFTKDHYKPGKRRLLLYNAIPEHFIQNDFHSNYATQTHDVETGNNIILPMEQNIIRKLAYYDESDYIESKFYRERHIENAVVNNFKSTRWSSRRTRNNEDTSDHTLRSGLRCSVKNCFNRHSVNLSLFGIPKDFSVRKQWLEKCRITKDPKIVKRGTRVCSVHFEPSCFKNTQLKNRLIPGSVPSLFLDNASDASPVSINEVPVLSTCEDQFISPIELFNYGTFMIAERRKLF